MTTTSPSEKAITELIERLRACSDEALHGPDGEWASGAYPTIYDEAADALAAKDTAPAEIRADRDAMLARCRTAEADVELWQLQADNLRAELALVRKALEWGEPYTLADGQTISAAIASGGNSV